MRKDLAFLVALAGLASLVSLTHAATVTLYLTTVNATETGGTWQLYIADSDDNDGLANFDVDIVGSGGVVVNSAPTFKGPRPSDPSSQYADGAGGNMGFNTSVTIGSNVGAGRVGITAGQDTVYAANDDPTFDMGVLVGVGQEAGGASPQNGTQGPIDGSGTPTGSTFTPWSYTPGTFIPGPSDLGFEIEGTLIEQGTYTDSSYEGSISANVDGFVEVLGTSDNGINEPWGLPPYQQGNTPTAAIQPNSNFGPPNPRGDTITFFPEPSALGLLAIALGLIATGRRTRLKQPQ